MKQLFALLSALTLAGCLSVTPPTVAHWDLNFCGELTKSAQPQFEATRLQPIVVMSPADSRAMMVLREDGTVAFDTYNEFAALPSQLLRKVVSAAMLESGLFKAVAGPGSTLRVDNQLEVEVRRWRLNCSVEGARQVEVELALRILNKGELVKLASGCATADATKGDYGEAFSQAASLALIDALGKLR